MPWVQVAERRDGHRRKLRRRRLLPSWKINQFSDWRTIYILYCNKHIADFLPKTGLSLELPTEGFICLCVMPENQTPATKPEPGSAPDEFNFAKSAAEGSRIKRRSLKTKPGGLIRPAAGAPRSARELEHEGPPLTAEQAAQTKAREVEAVKTAPITKAAETPVAPPRTTPSSVA